MAVHPRPGYTARRGEAVQIFLDDRLNFAIGNGRITIASDDPVFVDAVTRDIGVLAHTSEGEAALQSGDALGHPVRIVKPDPPTEPPNGWIIPTNLAAASSPDASIGPAERGAIALRGLGSGCGSTIVYNPADWPGQADLERPTGAEVLLTALRQANLNAAGGSNPSAADWGCPSVRMRR